MRDAYINDVWWIFILVENWLCAECDLVLNRRELNWQSLKLQNWNFLRLKLKPNSQHRIASGKMQPLETTKRVLTWICVYPDANESSNTPLWKAAARIVIVTMLFSVTLCCLAACMTYVIINISTNLDDCLLTFMVFIGFSGAMYTMIVAFFVRSQVPPIFDRLSSIYDDRKYTSITRSK